jgi:hypothetical protein
VSLRFATPKAFGARVHNTKHRKGGSGDPPLFFHGQEAGRLLHFAGKDGGKKIGAVHISVPIFLSVALWASCRSQLSCADYGTSRSGHKTYGRFLGTIFFGGAGPPLVLENQRLATEKIPKKRKNSKKYAK